MITKKLYETDGMLRDFTAQVLSCQLVGKDSPCGAEYAIILDQTAFFPEGGGQTADTGNLGNAVVLDVQIRDGELLHYTDVPLPVGETVVGVLNWEQRLRKMQNHTGEHLISGIVHSQFGYDNVGFHLGSDEVTVDFNGVLTDSELAFVEYIANRVVAMNHAVTVSYPTAEEACALNYRSKLENIDDLRIVTIADWDCCACCAPHVNTTGQIGCIKILDSENWKTGVRVHMLCGLDALDDYTKRIENTARISNMLSAKQLETASAVERLLRNMQAEREQQAKLRQALLDCKIAQLTPTEGNLLLFEDLLDADTLRKLVNAGVAISGGICAAFLGNDTDGYRYIIGSNTIALRSASKEYNNALNGRGGGSDQMIQGTMHATRAEIEAYFTSQ